MRNLVLAALALALLVGGWLVLAKASPAWSVVVIVAEPPAGAWLPEGGGSTPRVRKLAGAGVRLPLATPERSLPDWLSLVLGTGGPQRAVLPAFEQREWPRVVSSSVALPSVWAERFDVASLEEGQDVVVGALDALEEAEVTRRRPVLLVLVARPGTAEGWDEVVGRTLDGIAPRVTLSRTLVVVADRAQKNAILIAPSRPDGLDVSGALGPEALGAEVARWMRLD